MKGEGVKEIERERGVGGCFPGRSVRIATLVSEG